MKRLLALILGWSILGTAFAEDYKLKLKGAVNCDTGRVEKREDTFYARLDGDRLWIADDQAGLNDGVSLYVNLLGVGAHKFLFSAFHHPEVDSFVMMIGEIKVKQGLFGNMSGQFARYHELLNDGCYSMGTFQGRLIQ
jgi:hypothetical protein